MAAAASWRRQMAPAGGAAHMVAIGAAEVVWEGDASATACRACARAFGLFLRRHHCRHCGTLVCHNCSRCRLTHRDGPTDDRLHRLCDPCAETLCTTGRGAVIREVPSETFCDAAPVAVVALLGWPALRPAHQHGPAALTRRASAAQPARIAAAAACRPPRAPASSSASEDDALDSCPSCSLTLGALEGGAAEAHLDACLSARASAPAALRGDRYTVHWWRAGGRAASAAANEPAECSICYEALCSGQRIAIMNCLCKFHEPCLRSWFERTALCPYHNGDGGAT